MSDHLHERPLTLDDYDAILDLWRRSGLTSIRPEGRDSRPAFARQFASGVQHIIGLEDGDRLLATIVATHDGRKGWLNRLVVDESHRRQGLARRLIIAAEQWLAAQGVDVWAVLIEDDNDPSLQLFQSAGYILARDILYLSKRPSSSS
ncbi:MAG TPA: GNAT family N-acetyltransferase [Anaerolineae bacterium]|nr:GNAT family N-acetyltransferase [Anaerolineae bacterium]